MTVEVANFISELNEAYPRTQDLINEGDDHIRLVKNVLQSTFPAYDRAVTMTAEKFNTLDTTLLLDSETGMMDITMGTRFKPAGVIDANFNPISNVAGPFSDGDAVPLGYLKTGVAFSGNWPVGSIYMTADARNPAEIFGFGTWEVFAEGRMLIGSTAGETDINGEFRTFVNGQEGGEYSHTITEAELPAHTHPIVWPTDEAGNPILQGDHTHNIYIDDDRGDGGDTDVDVPRGAPSDFEISTLSGGAHMHDGLTAGVVGGGLAGNNLPPYISVNIWIRVADPVEPPPEVVRMNRQRVVRR